MKKTHPAKTPNFQNINTSVMPLDYNRQQNYMGSQETMIDQHHPHTPINQTTTTSKETAEDWNKQLYRPASYSRALKYKNERSYLKKVNEEYKELDLFCDTEELKYFGLGTYFYVELFRRLTWLLFVMTLVQAITIIINWKGDGMSNYESSFSTYLIKTTIANYSGTSGTALTPYDTVLVALLPALNFVALLIFAFLWKLHRRAALNKQEEDNTDVKPQKFAIQFEGFDPDESNEEDIKKFFSVYGPVYEASLVRSHEDSLGYFEDLDSIQEEIRQEEHEIVLGSGSQESVAQLKQKKIKLQQKALELNVHPTTMAAYVHFQFQKSKKACLDEFQRHHLYAKCSHSCYRSLCCCCLPEDEEKVNFKGSKLLIRTEKVPAPEDINWSHFQLTTCGKIGRGCLAFFVILLFLCLSCAIIGLCSIYISSHSNNCDGLNISSYTATTAAATNNDVIMQCYCGAHLIDSFTDSTIKTACANYLTGLYVEQSIQYVVILTSSLTNFLFGLIVDKLINCVRPASQDNALWAKTLIYTIFLVFNSICVPILIYADIFGFKASSYVSFATLISTDLRNFLQADRISLYPNFTAVWYRNVSPIFTNFIIFNTLSVWVFFMIDKCFFADKSHLQNKEGMILQKRMNRQIVSYHVNAYKEMAFLYLTLIIIFLFFSGVPVLLPLGLFNIFSRYISNRSLLQKNSIRLDGLGQDFSSLSSLVFSVSLVFFPLMGEWMIIANSKVATDAALIFGSFSSNYGLGLYELQMEFYLPFYIGISVVALLEWAIYSFIRQCAGCLCGGCECCQTPPPNFHSRPFWQYAKHMNILCSYNIRKNDKMKNAILYLQKYVHEVTKI